MIELPPDAVAGAASSVRESFGDRPAPLLALVLGSGLGGVVESFEDDARVPYAEIPHFPETSVQGHGGELVVGVLEGAEILAFAGRFHLYEGYSAEAAAFPVRLAHALGARTLIVSNAAGGISRTFRPGDLMVIRDQINLMWRSPLTGDVRPDEPRFPEMVDAYDPALADIMVASARDAAIPVVEGVYAGVAGPSYETPAEIRMLERLGADAVAMSIIPEVIAARSLGMRVGGISCITNPAAGVTAQRLDHSDVVRVAGGMAAGVREIIRGVVNALRG
ncbi:MAG TPA: purine-nucleoside phosphorylase [Gemmatimonadaceae bacterium]|jgi:purine-nucleoside phosphorylase|nr:purine-nucleoside phosphorylase [Gemmatimonadaceae bacterium]